MLSAVESDTAVVYPTSGVLVGSQEPEWDMEQCALPLPEEEKKQDSPKLTYVE